MIKLLFFAILLVIFLIVWREISEFKQKEIKRKEKLNQLLSSKEQLSNEELRSSSLEVEAKTAIRKAKNNAFEKEIKNLEENK
jgi:uncharacterized protein YpmS